VSTVDQWSCDIFFEGLSLLHGVYVRLLDLRGTKLVRVRWDKWFMLATRNDFILILVASKGMTDCWCTCEVLGCYHLHA